MAKKPSTKNPTPAPAPAPAAAPAAKRTSRRVPVIVAPDFSFDQPPFLGVVIGARGGIVAVFPGETEGEAMGPAFRKWSELQAKFEAKSNAGRDTGTAPLHCLYVPKIANA